MATTWICDKCGRPNLGALCPGCAEPRPMMARYSYAVVPQYFATIDDGVSRPKFQPIWLLPIAPGIIFLFTGLPTVFKIALLAFFGLPAIWNYLLVPLRIAYYRRRNR